MRSLEFILSLRPAIPFSAERGKTAPPSNGEVKRWLMNGAVHINGRRMGPDDVISDDVASLVFFPNSTRRTTVI